MFFKLFSWAPLTFIKYSGFFLWLGYSIFSTPLKYFEVSVSESNNWLTVPWPTISPPKDPAIGPISTIWSADKMISSSCSTTITVLPISFKFFKILIRLSLSLEWRPIDGSSRIYVEPTRLLPREDARLILWVSPPDKVFAFRFSVRYPNPTLFI